MRSRLGICQWFHYMDHDRVLKARALLRSLGVRHLRIDVSWADYHREQGQAWYAWLFEALAEFELLPCLWHTPPSISMSGKSNGPPEDPHRFGEFVWEVIDRYGHAFQAIELWNEPNNTMKWDTAYDPSWSLFAAMLKHGAATAEQYGKKTVLGGMSPIDGGWLEQLQRNDPQVLEHIQVIGFHAFPGQWNEREEIWGGWPAVFDHLEAHAGGREIWLTEAGRSTPTQVDEHRQCETLSELLEHAGRAGRIYWYSLLDLPTRYDELEFVVAGYREPLEHSLGLVREDSSKKPAFFALDEILRTSGG